MKLCKSLLLVLIICLSFSNVALAADDVENENEDSLNEYLRDHGYPESIINLLIVEQKRIG